MGLQLQSQVLSDLFPFIKIPTFIKGVKTISTFMNDIKCLSKKKALNSHAKAYFSNDIS